MARTPEYYRMKAEENRTIAEGCGDNRARAALLGVAEQ